MTAEPPGAADSTGEQEATKAATAAEEQATQAASTASAESETQSIHAWSLADDEADADLPRQRSWKIPAALAAVAFAASIGVGISIWKSTHHASTPAPVQQAAAPLPADPNDAKFIGLLRIRGVTTEDAHHQDLLLQYAHVACSTSERGYSNEEIIRMAQAHAQSTPTEMTKLVNAATEAICPHEAESKDAQYLSLMRGQHLLDPDTAEGNRLSVLTAHTACSRKADGASVSEVVDDVVAGAPGMSRASIVAMVDTAVAVYCQK